MHFSSDINSFNSDLNKVLKIEDFWTDEWVDGAQVFHRPETKEVGEEMKF